jgi:hypothetical protein
MSWQDCIAEIRAAAGEIKLTDAQIERLLMGIVREARRRSGLGAPTVETIRLGATDLAERVRITAAIEKRNARLNMLARIGRRERIEAMPGQDFVNAIKSEIHGTNTPTPTGGERYSARAEGKAMTRRWVEGATRDLERAGLFQAAKSQAMEPKWTAELFELSKGKDGNPGASGSPEALEIARIFHKYQDDAKATLNRAGGWIGDYSGYITRTSHDPDLIRNGGKRGWAEAVRSGFRTRPDGLARWKDAIRPLLDERTFDYVGDAPEARERFLDNVYHGLITGVHLTHEGMQGFKDPAFTGPANLAERLSHERVLHFKDAQSWLSYHREFGVGTAAEAVLGNLERSARAAALMRRYGTNPRGEFAADLKYLEEKYRNDNPQAVQRLGRWQQDLQNRFDFLDGTANIPVNRMVARLGAAVRLDESLAKLGGVMLTHLSVGMTKAAELRYQGANLFERYGNFFTSLKPRGEIHDELLAGLEGARRDLVSRYEIDDTIPGTLSKLANTFFKWNVLTPLFNMQRRGGEELMAHILGRQLGKEFGELDPASQRLLKLFGIEDKEWALLRQVPDHFVHDGRTYLTPESATRIPDSAAIQHLYDIDKTDSRLLDARGMRQVNALRDDLALKLYAMFNDRSEFMVIVPDIDTRATLLRNTKPGDAWGEFARFFWQFKSWPAALIRNALGREIYGGQSRLAAVSGIVQMAVVGAVLGYGIMTLKDLAKFRNPRDPTSLKTWAAALMQGGGLGLFGDFLFGEYDRYGRNFSESLMGPVIGELLNTTVVEIWNRLKAQATDPAHTHDIWPVLAHAVVNNTPAINLFYTRWALDYLFLWQVQEALNPGFLKRFEKRIRDQNHQTMWLSPSSVVESHTAPRPRAAPVQPWGWLR